MDFANYVTGNALILIPVLYVLGMIVKSIEKINDRYIPIILLAAGVVGTVGMMGFSVNSVVQGILVAGASVYTDQIIKQDIKKQ